MNDILKLNVGIAGCGTMGLPMLEVLLKNGVNAFGYDCLLYTSPSPRDDR